MGSSEYAYFAGKHLVCDYSEGNIYSMSLDTYANGSETRKWLRSWQDPAGGKNRRYSRLSLHGEMGVGLQSGQGSDPQVMLRCLMTGERLGVQNIGNHSERLESTALNAGGIGSV